jgi:hypothetical protein
MYHLKKLIELSWGINLEPKLKLWATLVAVPANPSRSFAKDSNRWMINEWSESRQILFSIMMEL